MMAISLERDSPVPTFVHCWIIFVINLGGQTFFAVTHGLFEFDPGYQAVDQEK